MSRCFSYPPPGYVKIGGCVGEGSIESTKLQKGKNKTDTERRKEKKRRKEKNELLGKQKDAYDGKIEKLRGKKFLYNEKTNLSAVLSDDSSRSGLSEEHDQPVPESQFCLSDGTDSSKKRKLDAPSPIAQGGKKIRIRFTLKRQSDPEAPLVREPVCSTSTSGHSDPPAPPPCQVSKTHVKEPSSSSANLKLTKEEKPSIESMYRALVEEWAPPPILAEREDPDNQEWLFGAKPQKAPGRLKAETSSDGPYTTGGCHLWPMAHHLPDVEIFALPYTVPF